MFVCLNVIKIGVLDIKMIITLTVVLLLILGNMIYH